MVSLKQYYTKTKRTPPLNMEGFESLISLVTQYEASLFDPSRG